ncbi:unnamed protein product [marine sediment metagenome]|uniref:Uncharacterized protein n=1 Tax=marine sediment metagenome TaxID=412755 RepID=X1D305_9ZZZZ
MTGYRATITITRMYTTRALADVGLAAIVSKVPAAWELQRESVDKE